jgi:uncharacterized protein
VSHSPAAGAGASLPPLRPVPLTELRLLDEGRFWEVDQPIAELATLTPVRGSLRAQHHGTVLELEASLATIVTLCCDRCLAHFNQALQAELRELIELRAGGDVPDPSRPEADDLDERLDPQGRFDPERWIYEQLSLRLPLVNRCGADCPGPATWSSEPPPVDPRWAALQGLTSS